MTSVLRDAFADTGFWIALVVKQDQYHARSQQWAIRVQGRIITTSAVLLETANTLSRPQWRTHVIALFEHLSQRSDVEVLPLSPELFDRGWDLYRKRPDKGWSLTDCVSFMVMQDRGLTDALAADEHFRQAGFRTILLETP